jgi:hypothetical protein
VKVRPLLGDFEIPHVVSTEAVERRDFVELPVPGRTGSLFQDLDSAPTRVAIAGSVHGDDAREQFLTKIRDKFRSGEPLTFVADAVTATSIQYVIIDALAVEESGTRPDQLDFFITLRESPPPPPPPNPLGGLDAGLLDEAGGFMDSVTGALGMIDALGSIPNIGDPTPPLAGALDGVEAATAGLDGIANDLTDLIGGSQ